MPVTPAGTGMTFQDIGACDCPGACYQAFPCNLPGRDLNLGWTNGTLGNGTTTLFWNGTYFWESNCIQIGTLWYRFQLIADASVTTTAFVVLSGSSCAALNVQCFYPANYYAVGGYLNRTGFGCAVGAGGQYQSTYSADNIGCPAFFSRGFTNFQVIDNLSTPALCPCGPFAPCILPFANLNLNWTIGGVSGTSPFGYGGNCVWQPSGCITNGSGPLGTSPSFFFRFDARGNVSEATLQYYPNSFCNTPVQTYSWRSDGSGSMTLTLSAYTCSPLSMTFTGGGQTVTIVP
jgi:hypothetical protein